MTPLFPAQRRAERFDSLVEGSRHDADTSTADLLELVGALRSMPEPHARPEFVADLREQLLVAARSEFVTPAARSRDEVTTRLTIVPRRTRRERRVSVALGAFAIIGATTSMAVASQSAIPGDALYPMKRAIENTQAGFSLGDDAKGATILDNATGRLDEVDQLTRASNPDAGLVRDTLDSFSDQATQAGDLLMSDYEATGHEESIQSLQSFTAQSMDVLAGLAASIPESAQDALHNAAQVLLILDSAADQVCPGCAVGISETPPQLLAGGTEAVDEAAGTVAGGELPGTVAPSDGAATGGGQHQANGGKGGGKPSTLNPTETPVSVPPVTVDPNDATNGLDDVVPTETTTGNGDNGKGGKKKPKPDLSPVTDTVNEVVTDVVDGVNDVLNGLSGK